MLSNEVHVPNNADIISMINSSTSNTKVTNLRRSMQKNMDYVRKSADMQIHQQSGGNFRNFESRLPEDKSK